MPMTYSYMYVQMLITVDRIIRLLTMAFRFVVDSSSAWLSCSSLLLQILITDVDIVIA